MLEYLKDRHVSITLWDRDSPTAEMIGGGIKEDNPQHVMKLLHIDEDWVEFQWQHSGQIVAVPTDDIVCIATDGPLVLDNGAGSATEAEVSGEGDWGHRAGAFERPKH